MRRLTDPSQAGGGFGRHKPWLALAIILAMAAVLLLHYLFYVAGGPVELRSGISIPVLVATAAPGETLGFSVDGAYKVFPGGGERRYEEKDCAYYGLRLHRAAITLEGGTLRLNGHPLPGRACTVAVEQRGALRFRGVRYGGCFEVRAESDDGLRLVNHVDLEHYLAGVLFEEMPRSFPEEALKAQVVAARSYALHRLRSGGPLLTVDTRSQVYGGLSAEDGRSIALVRATFGEVLVWKGKVLPAYFSSTCGGITASAREVFGGDAPAPVCVIHPCGYCNDSPFYAWRVSFPAGEVRKRLGLPAEILDFEVGSTAWDGAKRTLEFSILDGHGGILRRYPAERFRAILNRNRPLDQRLLSTWIDRIRKKGDRFVFEGRGWGHGVGLCQYGARGMAVHGRTYREILEYYYPGAVLAEAYGAVEKERPPP